MCMSVRTLCKTIPCRRVSNLIMVPDKRVRSEGQRCERFGNDLELGFKMLIVLQYHFPPLPPMSYTGFGFFIFWGITHGSMGALVLWSKLLRGGGLKGISCTN